MPIYKGNKEITAIYKGDTPISAIYKGDTLIFSSGTWEQYLYEYIYYSLVPTTINSKQVKNKARVNTIYGNSVVENQLVTTSGGNQTINGVSFTNNGDGSWTLNGTATANTLKGIMGGIQLLANHTYLYFGAFGGSPSTAFINDAWSGSISDTGSGRIKKYTANTTFQASIYVVNGTTCNNLVFKPQLIDLTQRYPINTPTTLTDTRVQALLNRGYIPYNTGTLKSVDVGAISSEDSNNNPLQSITFKYQGSGVGTAHDTMEIGKDNVVFTKNNCLLDLNQVSGWYYDTALQWGTNQITNFNADNAVAKELLCEKYSSIRFNGYASSSDNNLISFRDNGYVYVKNGNSSSQPSGLLLYTLATPQVIRIPRKRLGIVDLGSLGWGNPNTYGEVQCDDMGGIIKPIANANIVLNAYCVNYANTTANTGYHSTTLNKVIYQWQESVGTGGRLVILDKSFIGLNSTQVKTLLQGQYLFYETVDEVADIPISLGVESGGTLTTDSDVLPNILMEIKCK